MPQRINTARRELCLELDKGMESGAILACLPDGTKTLFAKGENEVFLTILRSKLVDMHFLSSLSRWVGREDADLGAEFEALPTLDDVVDGLKSKLTGTSERVLQSREDIELLVEWYRGRKGRFNPYAADVRIFRSLLALREALCDLDIRLIVVDDMVINGHRIARRYNYQTNQALPLCPPICAMRATNDVLALISSGDCQVITQRKRKGTGADWAGELPIVHFRKDQSLIMQAGGMGANRLSGPVYCARIEGNGYTAVLEIGAEQADPRDVKLALFAIAAALDSTDALAVQSLLRLLPLNKSQESEMFRRLLFLYQRGLEGVIAKKSRFRVDASWHRSLGCIRDWTKTVLPGTFSSDMEKALHSAVIMLRARGNGQKLLWQDVRDALRV